MNGSLTLNSYGDEHWTLWSPKDQSLYESAFAAWEESGSYETNFAYIQQECREQAWKFTSNHLLVTACARGSASEFVFMLPPTGLVEHAVRVLPHLCASLIKGTGRRVILRKLPDELHANLLASGSFKPVPLESYRNPRELPEDIHPQVVAPTRRINEFTGSVFVKIRNNIKAACRLHQISFCNLNLDNRGDVTNMIEHWAQEHNKRLHQSKSAGKTPLCAQGVDPAAYTIFCERFSTQVDNRLYFGRVMMVDGQIGGFCFAGRTSRNAAGLYASICRERVRGVSECMIVDLMDLLAQNEVELLNFGGSEGFDLFQYKNKWNTIKLISTNELEFNSISSPTQLSRGLS